MSRDQLSRQAGARIGDAVKIDRSTRWGNPHKTGPDRCPACRDQGRLACHSRDGAIAAYRADLLAGRRIVPSAKRPNRSHDINDVQTLLPGRTLACWCPVSASCHGDVLLEIANGGEDL
jgi:hypothetical protein